MIAWLKDDHDIPVPGWLIVLLLVFIVPGLLRDAVGLSGVADVSGYEEAEAERARSPADDHRVGDCPHAGVPKRETSGGYVTERCARCAAILSHTKEES